MPSNKPVRDEIANKLLIINKIINNGYEKTAKALKNNIDKTYCESVKFSNPFAIKETLSNELKNLINI